jgi:signal transduction histidine kinase
MKCDKDIENDLPRVWVDEAQITEAITELLRNAITAVDCEPYVSVAARVAPDGQQVLLSIRDNGPGMDARGLARAFTPFYSTRTGGSQHGLGLSVAWRYVVNNQGSIWIESKPGQGTTVHLTLPLA